MQLPSSQNKSSQNLNDNVLHVTIVFTDFLLAKHVAIYVCLIIVSIRSNSWGSELQTRIREAKSEVARVNYRLRLLVEFSEKRSEANNLTSHNFEQNDENIFSLVKLLTR